MLHRMGIEPLTNRLVDLIAHVALGQDADLDEFMPRKSTLDLGYDGIGQSGVADHDRRFERMGTALERLPLDRRERGEGFCVGVHQ